MHLYVHLLFAAMGYEKMNTYLQRMGTNFNFWIQEVKKQKYYILIRKGKDCKIDK